MLLRTAPWGAHNWPGRLTHVEISRCGRGKLRTLDGPSLWHRPGAIAHFSWRVRQRTYPLKQRTARQHSVLLRDFDRLRLGLRPLCPIPPRTPRPLVLHRRRSHGLRLLCRQLEQRLASLVPHLVVASLASRVLDRPAPYGPPGWRTFNRGDRKSVV